MPKTPSTVDPLPKKDRRNSLIKSYVLRTGRLTKAQKLAFDEGWDTFGINYQPKPLNYVALFGNNNPVWLEVGFGNGDSLYQMAKAMPNTNFIGVEVHTPGVGYLLTMLNKAPLRNLKILEHDAMDVLKENITDGSLARFLLFFPDPWPKKKHHKRRFVRPEMIALLARKIQPKGVWHIATDWQPYAEYCLAQFAEQTFFSNVAEAYAKKPNYRPLTKFEQRGLNLGHEVFDCLFEKQ